MSIFPLPVFEADADPHHRNGLTDEEIYARLKPPSTIVVRFGRMKLVGEFPYNGAAKPGCGSKLVVRTHRGTELGEMLTTTCENAGCSKSVTRNEMLDYIESSGGTDYPFHTDGQVIRLATIEDINRQREIENNTAQHVRSAKAIITELDLPMKLVDVEPILGGELLTFFFTSEQRVDFREMVRRLAAEFKTRIEMRQVGARDEARLVADYERCGQYCCCKNFLKVLKPVSMRSAKIQKATLDPLKISGRCGRLMCCLRYEDKTYDELRKALPKNNTRVGTREGPGVVVDSKILVQLVLVRLDESEREIAVPVEELMDPETCPKPGEFQAEQMQAEEDALRGMPVSDVRQRIEREQRPQHSTREGEKQGDGAEKRGRGRRRRRGEQGQPEAPAGTGTPSEAKQQSDTGEQPRRRRRGRRGKRSPGDRQADFRARNEQPPAPGSSDAGGPVGPAPSAEGGQDQSGESRGSRRGRRGRRRRMRGGGGESTGGGPPREPQ
jgi:cell fate regulator YaaT (PSP1 superfamily)